MSLSEIDPEGEGQTSTPQQLNIEFRQLYNLIPPLLNEDYEQGPDIDPGTEVETFGDFIMKLGEALEHLSEEELDEIDKESDAEIAEWERRDNSELRKVWGERLNHILSQSPITSSFRKYIYEEMDTEFVGGMNKDEPEKGRLYWLLDMECPNGGGIFDPERAQELERQAYQTRTMNNLRFKNRTESFWGPTGDAMSALLFTDTPITNQMVQWRQEFIEFYGNEP